MGGNYVAGISISLSVFECDKNGLKISFDLLLRLKFFWVCFMDDIYGIFKKLRCKFD